MDTADFDRYLTDRDKAVIALSGYGQEGAPGERPALLVIDVTYAFCGEKPEPILESVRRFRNSSGQAAWDAVGVIGELADTARACAIPVIYTRGMSSSTPLSPGQWANKNKRTAEDTGALHEIVAPIAPLPQDIVLQKAKPSAFFGTALLSHLIELKVDSLIVCGGTTSGCVRASVVDAFSYNFAVSVVADACFDRVEASGDIGLLDMNLKYANVVTSIDAIKLLSAKPRPATAV